MSLLVAFPFCAKDVARLHDLLQWCFELSGRVNYEALLVADPATPWDDGVKALHLAEKAFQRVDICSLPTHVEGWIPGSNALFRLAAEKACERKTPFVFVEADAVPLKPDWLDQLADAYQRSGKPFMGVLISHQRPNLPSPYLEGVAIYPPDSLEIMRVWPDDLSWTLGTAGTVVSRATSSPLFHHLWGETNNPPTFRENNIPGTNVFCPRQIPPEAVIYHRAKDGSLIRLLRKARGIPHAHSSGNGVMRVVSLRRSGDIIALLPLLRQFAKTKEVELVVHSDFYPLLDGVSYVHPLEWKGGWEEPLKAAEQFHAQNAQVFGQGVVAPPNANFARHAWELLGTKWNRYYPLVFDQRDRNRETELAAKVFLTDRPKVLLKLHGFSSPFSEAQFVRDAISQSMGNTIEIVDMDSVKAERLYDVFGLMDRAHCLVSIDTFPIHINRSHTIPTVALVHGNKWRSSPSVGNVVCRCGYDVVRQRIGDILAAIRVSIQPDVVNEDMVLVFSEWRPRDLPTLARTQQARATWRLFPARQLGYHGGRSSAQLRDPNHLPFFHDMIKAAWDSGKEDIIVVTNNDISFDPKLPEAIRRSCRLYGCYWAYRVEQAGGPTDEGVDVVAFTRKWWQLHYHLIPDLLFGQWWWDNILTRIMEWSGCPEGERVYYHPKHPSWMVTRNRTPGWRHNWQLASRWLEEHGEPNGKPQER